MLVFADLKFNGHSNEPRGSTFIIPKPYLTKRHESVSWLTVELPIYREWEI